MAIGDIMELTHVQHYTVTGEKCMNKYFFSVVDILGNAQKLYDAFIAGGGLMSKVNAFQNETIANDSVKVVNLFDVGDFYDAPVTGVGAVTADSMLPFHDCVNVALKIDTRGLKPGSKRYSGLTEAQVAGGVITNGSTLTALSNLITALVADVVGTGPAHFDPVVVKRIFVPAAGDVKAHYRLPLNFDELNYGHIIGGLANLRVSHQVSRGNGR